MGNMSKISEFIKYVVNDGWFSLECSKKALNQLKKNWFYDEIELWEGYLQKIQEAMEISKTQV